MINWHVFLPVFFTAMVEWVEAFTIVLAVAMSIGWRSAIGASLSAFAALAVLTVFCDRFLEYGATENWVQGLIGVLLLLFGLRWLAKAIAREAGLRAMHDEAREYAETRERLDRSDRQASWMIAFNGVLVEGLEVWLIVVALGIRDPGHVSAYGAAIAALLLVIALGAIAHAPLSQIPENLIKFGVGAAITAFGTFWTLTAIGGDGIWPAGDWSLAILGLFYFCCGQLIARTVLRRPQAT
jgi:uncharacterized membrane protein